MQSPEMMKGPVLGSSNQQPWLVNGGRRGELDYDEKEQMRGRGNTMTRCCAPYAPLIFRCGRNRKVQGGWRWEEAFGCGSGWA